MLRGIHKASGSWLGKLIMAAVMGVLVISFAIWGIGDIFRGFGQNEAAKVGSTEISLEQFRDYYNQQLQQISRRAGRPITPDQARGLGIDRQIIGQLVAETTLDERARQLNLGISNDDIAKLIVNDPNFRGANGQFDRDRFSLLIRNAGFTEGRFVEEQRRVLLRRQIAQTISGGLKVPNAMMLAVDQFRNEKRNIEYVALGPAQAGDIAQPTLETLKQYFDERKVLFRAPEYRKLTVLSLSPGALAKPDAVSDTDARAYYDTHKSDYGTPEKRELQQMVFPSAEEAAAARERIAKGVSFADVAKERGLKPSDTEMGMVSKTDIIDPVVAEAVFALKPGDVSEPVKGQFGTVLLMVGKTETGTQKSFDEVAPRVKQAVAENRAKSQLGELRDKVEDDRAAGSTLAETAKKFGLKAIAIDAVDRSGRGPDGEVIADLPKTPDVVAAAFASNIGVDNEALQLPGGGWLWFDVNGVTPSHERALDEVKDQVATRWRDDEIAKRLQGKAGDMLGKLKSGSTLAHVAAEAGIKVETATGLQRGKSTDQVPGKALQAIFSAAKGASSAAEGATPDSRIVFTVTDVTDSKLDPLAPDTQKLEASLQNSYADDIIGEYLARLESELGVTLNQTAINQIIGGGTLGQ
jgi:peptidyl-prolyl cis-trans isomerase D